MTKFASQPTGTAYQTISTPQSGAQSHDSSTRMARLTRFGDREHFHVARAAQDAVYSHFEADKAEEKADELQIVLAGRHGLGRGGGIEEHGDDRRAEQLQKDAQQHGDQHDHPIGRAVAPAGTRSGFSAPMFCAV